jgi:hypothetical protein
VYTISYPGLVLAVLKITSRGLEIMGLGIKQTSRGLRIMGLRTLYGN